MRRTTRDLLLTVIVLIASVMIAVSVIGCKNDSPAPTLTPQPSVSATPTPQPTVTATATQTPASNKTNTPTAIPKSTQTSGPTATSTPPPTATPVKAQTAVSINTSGTIKQGSSFIISINITNVSYMAIASLDLQFNSSCVAYVSCNATSRIGTGSGSVAANVIQPGILRVMVDYSDYAIAHNGSGISGSGYLCKLNFTATAQGASPLNFISGQGSPEGKITLIKWTAYTQSTLESVSWINSTITVIP